MRTEEQILTHLRAMQDTARRFSGTLGEEYQKVYDELIASYRVREAIKPPQKVWNADISQAPKDGTEILISTLVFGRRYQETVIWAIHGLPEWSGSSGEYVDTEITAWMLIPPLDI